MISNMSLKLNVLIRISVTKYVKFVSYLLVQLSERIISYHIHNFQGSRRPPMVHLRPLSEITTHPNNFQHHPIFILLQNRNTQISKIKINTYELERY